MSLALPILIIRGLGQAGVEVIPLVPSQGAAVANIKMLQLVVVVARRLRPGVEVLDARRPQPQAVNGVVALASTRQLVTTRIGVAAIAAAIEAVGPEATTVTPCLLSRVIVEDLQ